MASATATTLTHGDALALLAAAMCAAQEQATEGDGEPGGAEMEIKALAELAGDPEALMALLGGGAEVAESVAKPEPQTRRVKTIQRDPLTGFIVGIVDTVELVEAAPGPPPRPGLVFDESSHRWTRPESPKQKESAAPGPPPRPGLVFDESSHRWTRPESPKQKESAAPSGASKSSGAGKAAKAVSTPQGGHPGAAHGSAVKVSPAKTRALSESGEPAVIKNPLTKQETGRVGEAVVLAWLKSQGFKDARPMNTSQTNFPVDLIEDHAPTEVKAGMASNGRKAQQWRLTFSKESKKEVEMYEKMTPEERSQWNAQKQQRIHERKLAVLKAVEKQTGKKQKPRTVTTIINPDTRTADIYVFDGWHDRIDWQSDMAKKAYKGSVQYDHDEG